MPNLNAAIAYMETACNTWSLGYDQSNRWDVRDGGDGDACRTRHVRNGDAGTAGRGL